MRLMSDHGIAMPKHGIMAGTQKSNQWRWAAAVLWQHLQPDCLETWELRARDSVRQSKLFRRRQKAAVSGYG